MAYEFLLERAFTGGDKVADGGSQGTQLCGAAEENEAATQKRGGR